MNAALFGAMLKAQARSVVNYALGMVFYLWLFIWIFPSFAGSQSFAHVLQAMPSGLLRVLGYTAGVTQLSGFLGGEFYSLLYLVILAIYVLFGASRLVAHLIDNGSMAYLLATPVSRAKVAVTQAAVLVVGIFVIGLCTTVSGLVGAHWFIHNAGLNALFFVQLNTVGVLLFCVIGGYAFAFSCLAGDERSALGLAALLTIGFYVLHTVGQLTPRLAWVNHLSLFTAFNAQALMHGNGMFAVNALSLAGASVLLFGIGVAGFSRRQLPL